MPGLRPRLVATDGARKAARAPATSLPAAAMAALTTVLPREHDAAIQKSRTVGVPSALNYVGCIALVTGNCPAGLANWTSQALGS